MAADLPPSALDALERAVAAKDPCLYCFREKATDDDWERYEPGEGDHLCWGQEDCQDATEEMIPALLRLARRAAEAEAERDEGIRQFRLMRGKAGLAEIKLIKELDEARARIAALEAELAEARAALAHARPGGQDDHNPE